MPLIGRIASAAARGYGLFANIVQAVAVDPYFNYVVALLHGDGTNGGQNNTFLDSSTNNFTITRNGNTTQGSFSPFSQTGWGNYFNGSSYLQASSSSAFDFGTGSFTVEAFVFTTSFASVQTIVGTRTGDTSTTIRWVLYVQATNGQLECDIWNTSNSRIGIFSHQNALKLNDWNHVALVRNNTEFRLYVNGVQSTSSATSSSAVANSNLSPTIGQSTGGSFSGSNAPLSGYLSSLRIVNGTAVYTSNFTVPTTPLTAITNTSLLTCQYNRFRDASTNNLTITTSGSPSVQPFSPFNPTTAYSTGSIGGSGYFDGSGDYLTTSPNAAFRPSGNFTIEAWVYLSTVSGIQNFFTTQDGSGFYQFSLGTNGTNARFTMGPYSGAYAVAINGGTLTTGAWFHIAVARSGTGSNNIRMWVNGSSVAQATSNATPGTETSVEIGREAFGGSNPFTGYMSGLRIVTGSAVYDPTQSTITVPTSPLTAVTNTSFLLNFTNGAIFDNAAVADYETVGNAQISTSVKKYGTGSLAFDGTGDYLVAPSRAVTSLSGDFTIEFWAYRNSGPFRGFTIGDDSLSSGLSLYYSPGSSAWLVYNANTSRISGGVSNTSVWYHMAVVRVAGIVKLYVNGTQAGSTWSSTGTFSGAVYVSVEYNAGTAYSDTNGYIDDFRITNGIGRYPYNFTPPEAEFPNIGGTITLTADPYYEYTTLLLPGNGTNGAQNNTFLDSSTNAFTITRNGNTTQGTFSPFSQTGWSNNFDGNGDYLTFTGSSALTATGDFTFECWIYVRSIALSGASNPRILTSPNGLTVVLVSSTNNLRVDNDGVGASPISTANNSIIFNQWMHVAVVRSGSTLTAYLNGTSAGSATHTSTFTETGSIGIGYTSAGGGGGYFDGYISNMRMVVGTAVYTANFTPPTAALTAITNTQLLTCQSNRFVDNSSNAFALTRAGDTSIQAFSPFNPTASWSAATYGGSGYFDGSGDYLQAGTNANLALGSGDFTIEGWHYCTGYNGGGSLYSTINTYPSSTGLLFYIDSIGRYTIDVNGTILQPAGTAVLNAWVHWAVVRNGSTLSIYINGTSIGSVSSSTNYTDQYAVIGRTGAGTNSNLFLGYLSNTRMVKGTAVYTANFTPPTAPLTAVTNTQLLCNFTNAGIYDATSKNDLETVGNAQISTTQSKFGGSSMYFDGTGDGLTQPAVQNLNWSFGSGDMTIECWAYFNSVSGYQTLVDFRSSGGGFGTSSFVLWVDAGTLSFFAGAYSGASPVLSGGSISTGQWYHIVISRYGGTTKLFLNGNQTATTTNAWAQTFSATDILSIGATTNVTGNYLNGYIDDLRITKGIARYTSNFTPPTTAFLTL